jgi:hypothetical protein
MTTEVDIAWMAGLFEGEGNIDWSTKSRSCNLRIAMTDLDIIEKFQKLSECGTIKSYRPAKGASREVFLWRVCHRNHVSRLLKLMLPHFSSRKREKTILTLERLSLIKDRKTS